MAITALQIIAVFTITQLLPNVALSWDKSAGRGPQTSRTLTPIAVRELAMFGVLGGIVAYSNFLLFFVRHSLSPAYIDASSMVFAQAATITFATLAVCQLINILFVRAESHKQFFAHHIWSNKKLLLAFVISLFVIANLLYNPAIQQFFGMASLDANDWTMVIVVAGIYSGVRLLQRQTRKHAHHVVLKLHQEFSKAAHAKV